MKNMRNFAADFRAKSRSVISSSCEWKCRNLPLDVKQAGMMVRVYAWTLYCISLQGIYDNLHSKKWYTALRFLLLINTQQGAGVLK